MRPDGLEKAPNYLETLHLARRAFAVLTSLAVASTALLTWRLFGAGVGLITGVYTFGIVGVLLGPMVIGLLKAIVDTITATSAWRLLDDDETPGPTASRPA